MASLAPAHSGHPSAHDQLRMKRAGLWLFFASEAVLFGIIGTSRYYLDGIAADELNQTLGLTITAILIASSATAFVAVTALREDRRGLFIAGMIATIVLGVLFVAGVVYEWSTVHFQKEEIFGTLFFAMTGLHASHVVSGLGLLALALVHGLRGKYDRNDMWPVVVAVMWWEFVDVVWVFFYPTLYLVQGI